MGTTKNEKNRILNPPSKLSGTFAGHKLLTYKSKAARQD